MKNVEKSVDKVHGEKPDGEEDSVGNISMCPSLESLVNLFYTFLSFCLFCKCEYLMGRFLHFWIIFVCA